MKSTKKTFNNAEIKQLRKQAVKFGLFKRLGPDSSEDFAQYVLLRRICLKSTSCLRILLCDFMREELGRIGTPRSEGNRNTFGMKVDSDFIARIETKIGMGQIHFLPAERKIFYMVLAGFALFEIASVLDVTPGRVSQILSEIMKNIDLEGKHSLFEKVLSENITPRINAPRKERRPILRDEEILLDQAVKYGLKREMGTIQSKDFAQYVLECMKRNSSNNDFQKLLSAFMTEKTRHNGPVSCQPLS